MIDTNGAQLCTEVFGSRADPPVLLVMGLGASMLWWEEGFCRILAARGRFVIRYDHRDTGRSVTYEAGSPPYTGADLVADAVGRARRVPHPTCPHRGLSAGGAFAQHLALDFADRVLSLVLLSTSPATPGDRDLPSPTETFSRFASTAVVDWEERVGIEYLVDYARVLAGGERPFDEARYRDLVHRDVERAHNIAATQNHDVIPTASARADLCPRSPRRRSSSTAPPTRCSRSSTAGRWPPRSPVHTSSH